jgi:dTDP-4-amino-4,6-dideoxygalactose transaminase
MTDLNAALGLHQLKKVDRFLELRNRYTTLYDEAFAGMEELEILTTKDYAVPARHLYLIALNLDRLTLTRDEFLDEMQNRGIGVAVHYVALHLQSWYRRQYDLQAEDFPVATHYSERILSLPLYPKMSVQDIQRVIETVRGLLIQYRR